MSLQPTQTNSSQIVVDLSSYDELIQPSYRPLLFNQNRYLVLVGGAGAGKSYFIAQKFIFRCLTEGCTHIVARKTGNSHRFSTLPLLERVIEDIGFSSFVNINKSTMQLSFNYPFNASVFFLGLDNVEKLKSFADPINIFIEEASELSEDDFNQLDLRLRGRSGRYKQIMLSSNPVGGTNSWLYKKFFKSKPDNASVYNPTVYNNAYIDVEYIKQLERLAEENAELGEVYLKGNFVDLSGRIYNYDIVDDIPDFVNYRVYGMDFGYNDPSVLCEVGVYDNRDVYIKEHIYESKLSNNELIRLMKKVKVSKKVDIYADSAEPARIQDIKNSGFRIFPCKKGNNSKIDGINLLKNYQLHITKNSTQCMNDFDNYLWKKSNSGDSLDQPIDFFDHAPDAVRYAIYSKFFNEKNYDPSKPLMFTGLDVIPS